MTRSTKRSVWAFPRPPALQRVGRTVRVEFEGVVIALSDDALEILETSHPPTIYIPPADVAVDALRPSERGPTVCEWKGRATYLDVVVGDRVAVAAAWTYRDPVPSYEALRDHVAFYPGRMSACFVGEDRVLAQEGDFYGGWVTPDLEGPFKGAPGTLGW